MTDLLVEVDLRPFSTRAISAALASSKCLNSQSAIEKELKPIGQQFFYSQSNCRKEAPFFERENGL